MRIIVKDPNDGNVNLWIPTALVLNGFTALIAPQVLEKYDVHMTREQFMILIKTIRDCKRRFPNWVLAEVAGAEGETVFIKL